MQMKSEDRRYSIHLGSTVSKEEEVDDFLTSADGTDSGISPTRRKEESTESSTPAIIVPIIPQWGPAHSGKRVETEPVAKFTFARNSASTEIVFSPPMSGSS